MAAKPRRKAASSRASRSVADIRKARTRTPNTSQRTNQIGRMIALGSMVAAGMLIVIGVGAVVLLATEPSKRSGKWGGWNFNDLSNSARESLRSSLPSDLHRAVREDYLPEARAFVARQACRFS